jgi:hypothetical protein
MRIRDSAGRAPASPVLAALALLLAACAGNESAADLPGADSTDAGPAAATSAEPAGFTVEMAATPLLADEFDDGSNGWDGPFQRLEDGEYVWELPSGQSDSRVADTLISRESELDRTVSSTTFVAEGVLAVGIDCAYQELEGSSRWYVLELSTDGAAIVKRPLGDEPAETLARNDGVTLTDQPTSLTATCVLDGDHYLLSLDVNGTAAVQTIDEDPFGPGAPGLVVRAAPDSPDALDQVVRFDRFEVVEVTHVVTAG